LGRGGLSLSLNPLPSLLLLLLGSPLFFFRCGFGGLGPGLAPLFC
jgi:hypothetical protein